MKRILVILLFCLILENNVSTKRISGVKMLKPSKEINEISNSKLKNLRKLEETEDSTYHDYQTTISEDILNESEIPTTIPEKIFTQIIEPTINKEIPTTIPEKMTTRIIDTSFLTEIPTNLPDKLNSQIIDTSTPSEIETTQNEVIPSTIIDDQPEDIIATEENYNVSSTKPLSLKPKKTENKNAQVQFLKFYGFYGFKTPTESEKVTFGVYFYFLERTIPKEIIMRLRINYLELKYTAESARTHCLIEDTSLIETDSIYIEGKSVRYNCELKATIGNHNTANFSLNSDVSLILVNINGDFVESLDFNEINFNGNSLNESNNIQENEVDLTGDEYTLTQSVASTEKDILKITGNIKNNAKLLRRLEIDENTSIEMNFLDIYHNIKNYICFIDIDDNVNGINSAQIICNTSGNLFQTTPYLLNLSPGIFSNGHFILIKMNESNSISIISTEYIPLPSETYEDNTTISEPENISANVEDYTVNQNKPVSQKSYIINNKSSNIHIIKFHSFLKELGKINCNTIFYFIGKEIPYSIIYRLRISYNSRLRNLQIAEEEAESVRTDCIITHENLVWNNPINGEYVNYECSANSSIDTNISNIILNTDVNMIFVNKIGIIEDVLDFNTVNFIGNTSEESKNIQEKAEVIKSQSYLKDTIASIEKYNILKLKGKYESISLRRRLDLSNEATISMNFMTIKNNQNVLETYDCKFYQRSNIGEAELECNTSKNLINTTVENLHLSNGQYDDTLLIIEMYNWKTNGTRIIAEKEKEKQPSNTESPRGVSVGGVAAIIVVCFASLFIFVYING